MIAMPKPRPAPFDFAAALIDYQTDTTDALREKYPKLHRVWDELDELRGAPDSVSADEYQAEEDRADRWQSIAERSAERIDELVAEHDMSAHVQSVLENVADLLDGRIDE